MRNVNNFENGFKVSGMNYAEFQEKIFHFNTLILRAYSRISDSIHQDDLKGLDEKLSAIKDLEKDRYEFLKQFNFVENNENIGVKKKLENMIWHIKTNKEVLGDGRTLNDVLEALENMVNEKVLIAPVDDVILQCHQFTKQLGVVSSVLKEVRKSNMKEI